MASLQQCESLMANAAIKGLEITTIEEGCLGLGKVVIDGGEEYKSYVITEVFLNEWSSDHKIRKYNKLPKKYRKIINQINL